MFPGSYLLLALRPRPSKSTRHSALREVKKNEKILAYDFRLFPDHCCLIDPGAFAALILYPGEPGLWRRERHFPVDQSFHRLAHRFDDLAREYPALWVGLAFSGWLSFCPADGGCHLHVFNLHRPAADDALVYSQWGRDKAHQ